MDTEPTFTGERESNRPQKTQGTAARHITASTVAIVVMILVALGAVAAFLVWGPQIKVRLAPEVFNLTYEFLLVVVIGGAVSLLYGRFAAERDLARERRAALRQMHTELLAAYNAAKRVRRKLRAHVGYSSGLGVTPGARVEAGEYERQMDALMDAQLTFEVYAKRAADSKLWFLHGETLGKELGKIEKYLNAIIDEYEKEFKHFAGAPPSRPLTELGTLAEYIGPTPETGGFKTQFKDAAAKTLSTLASTELM
jgi:hypothetical protein